MRAQRAVAVLILALLVGGCHEGPLDLDEAESLILASTDAGERLALEAFGLDPSSAEWSRTQFTDPCRTCPDCLASVFRLAIPGEHTSAGAVDHAADAARSLGWVPQPVKSTGDWATMDIEAPEGITISVGLRGPSLYLEFFTGCYLPRDQ